MSGTPYQRLRPSGGYRSLRSFQTATAIYDATVSFCRRFVDPRSDAEARKVREVGREKRAFAADRPDEADAFRSFSGAPGTPSAKAL